MKALAAWSTATAVVAALSIAALSAPAAAQANYIPADEIVDIRRVPIQTLMRVTRADGNVFYISADRRWVIHGEVIDMWTGKNEHELDQYNQMRWERSGTNLEALKHPGWPNDGALEGAAFIPHGCEKCPETLRMLEEQGILDRLAPVPFSARLGSRAWAEIWCDDSLTIGALDKWTQNKRESSRLTCNPGEKIGRIQALAEVFHLDDQEITILTSEGLIVRGKDNIERWRQ